MSVSETLLLPHGVTITFTHDGTVGTVSDGYHTFNELYKHRCLLFCLAIEHDRSAWKSRLHADGTSLDGWFIAGTILHCRYQDHTEQKQITYHLPDEYWEICPAQERTKAPEWDGHTSMEVLDRLYRHVTNR